MLHAEKILRKLADGRFYSGEELAAIFGCSRAAIWKQLKACQVKYGVEFHPVRGKGYRLSQPVEWLNADQISSQLNETAKAVFPLIETYFSVTSTNDVCRDRVKASPRGDIVVLAEHQQSGRGRNQRKWCSPLGQNLYASIGVRFDISPAALACLPLAAGVCVHRALQANGFEEVKLKWPNDIYLHDRKLGGMLIELTGEVAGSSTAIIGLGLNLLAKSLGEEIDQPWTSLAIEQSDREISRNQLMASVLSFLADGIHEFIEDGFSSMRQHWKENDLYLGKTISVQLADRRLTGRFLDLNEFGGMLLEVEGTIVPVYSGDILQTRTA